jgi:hypothetical protein
MAKGRRLRRRGVEALEEAMSSGEVAEGGRGVMQAVRAGAVMAVG